MCGRYVEVTDYEVIEKKFNVTVPPGVVFTPNFNIAAGDKAPIITGEDPGILQEAHFGFTPSWAKKKMYVVNARSEGDHNQENLPNYTGAKGIISKPFFKSSIRRKRCLVIADAFIEGTTNEKLAKPNLVYLINQRRPFAMAGVYDDWVDQTTGEIFRSFAIITCPPNALMQKIPHHRMPVILDESDHQQYLDHDAPLNEITSLLRPYDHKLMNAYPIDKRIKSAREKDAQLIKPTGDRLQKEYFIQQAKKLELQGMGMSPSRRRKLQEEGKWIELLELEHELDDLGTQTKLDFGNL